MKPFVRLLHKFRTLETEWRHHWRVDRKWRAELIIIVFGSIFGFAVMIAVMVYISSISQH
jgi:hypothetical protein